MKKCTMICVVILVTGELASAADLGHLCVGPVVRRLGDRGVYVPPPGDPRFGKARVDRPFVFQIDDGAKLNPSAEHSIPVEVQDRSKRHLFSVYEGDEKTSSFKFDFRITAVQCITFDPFYETWHMTAGKSLAKCGCSGP